jgi:hypothetical protein
MASWMTMEGLPPRPSADWDAERPAGDGRGNRACPLAHIGPRLAEYSITAAGRTLLSHRKGGWAKGGGKRDKVAGFSKASRRRCFLTLMAITWPCPWPALLCVTLTYPGYDGREFIPQSGRVVKAHFKAFAKRHRREYGQPCSAFWKLEFQPREDHPELGPAPHLHLALVPPWIGEPWADEPECVAAALRSYRAWCSKAWAEVVGSGSAKHLAAGTQAVPFRADPSFYFSGYVSDGKNAQHVVPPNFLDVGRFWGVLGNLKVRRASAAITEKQMVTINRAARRYRWRRHIEACKRSLKPVKKLGVPKGRRALREGREKKARRRRQRAHEFMRDPKAFRDAEAERRADRRRVVGVTVLGGDFPLHVASELTRVLGEDFARGFTRWAAAQVPDGRRLFRSNRWAVMGSHWENANRWDWIMA